MKFLLCMALACALCPAQPLRVGTFAAEIRTEYTTAQGLPSNDVRRVWIGADGRILALTAAGAARFDGTKWIAVTVAPPPANAAAGPDGTLAEARPEGLFVRRRGGSWQRLLPSDGRRSWAVNDVRGVAFDSRGRLWFCSPQGAGVLDADRWTLYNGAEGLPYDDFTSVAGRMAPCGSARGSGPSASTEATGPTARDAAGCPTTKYGRSPCNPMARPGSRRRAASRASPAGR